MGGLGLAVSHVWRMISVKLGEQFGDLRVMIDHYSYKLSIR